MLDKLYENIGEKIKNWAKWIFIVEAIGAIITGFVILIDWGFEDGWWALFIILFGPIVAWVGSWILYAFGELVEDVHAIRNKEPSIIKIEAEQKQQQKPINQNTVQKQKDISPKTTNMVEINQTTPQPNADAKKEEKIEVLLCPECGEDLSFMGWDNIELKEKRTCPLCKKVVLFHK